MRLLLRCFLISTACIALIAGLLFGSLRFGLPSWFAAGPWVLLYPGIRAGSELFKSFLDSDSGAVNAIGLIVLSIPLNIIIYTGVLVLLFKGGRIKRRFLADR
jgi:hypothetical protein